MYNVRKPILQNISFMYMNEMHILKNQTCRILILSIEKSFENSNYIYSFPAVDKFSRQHTT